MIFQFFNFSSSQFSIFRFLSIVSFLHFSISEFNDSQFLDFSISSFFDSHFIDSRVPDFSISQFLHFLVLHFSIFGFFGFSILLISRFSVSPLISQFLPFLILNFRIVLFYFRAQTKQVPTVMESIGAHINFMFSRRFITLYYEKCRLPFASCLSSVCIVRLSVYLCRFLLGR